MISFADTPEGRAVLASEQARVASLAARTEAFADMGDSIALTVAHGHLLARAEVDEGEYAFFFPEPYEDGADTERTIEALELYAKRHEIPLTYLDLTHEQTERLRSRYRAPRVYAMDDDGDRFVLTVEHELAFLDGIPTLDGERVRLYAPDEADAHAYGALCRDAEGMRYFGYDALRDRPDASDELLVRALLRERQGDVACPFFIRADGRFVGELVLYAFDGKGGAELSVRLTASARGQGLAEDAVRTAMRFAADDLQLCVLYADCREENTAAIRLFTRLFGDGVRDGGVRHFCARL